MESSHQTIAEFIKNFLNDKYEDPSIDVQVEAGWYDWFCSDKALAEKTKKLALKIMQIQNSKLFDINKTYVFFKNNCPMTGNLYDSFSICDINTGDILFWVSPRMGHSQMEGFRKPLVVDMRDKQSDDKEYMFKNWEEVIRFFTA